MYWARHELFVGKSKGKEASSNTRTKVCFDFYNEVSPGERKEIKKSIELD